jgi:hypothetical protein
MAALTSPI